MTPIQLIAAGITVIGIVRACVLFKQRKLSFGSLVFWVIIWSSVGITAFIPAISYVVSQSLGISRGLDLLIYGSIVVLFYLVFRILMKLESLERKITVLVREFALRKK